MRKKNKLNRILEKIRQLHLDLKKQIFLHRKKSAFSSLFKISRKSKSDIIYEIDRVSEEVILSWFQKNWLKEEPVEIVMEGFDEGHQVFPKKTPSNKIRWKMIIDPIDGTRNLMYDKRSAWILTGIAPYRGEATTLEDIVVSVMTELPPSRQEISDQLWAIRGEGTQILRSSSFSKKSTRVIPTPSLATDFEHGFASICKFFPEGKELLSKWESRLWSHLYPQMKERFPIIFDDQCLSTAGQLYGLIMGQDRMIADLRPQAFRQLGLLDLGMCCHPYDLCTALM